MHEEVKPGIMYKFSCEDCGYVRRGLLKSSLYSWRCPECGGYRVAEEIKTTGCVIMATDVKP